MSEVVGGVQGTVLEPPSPMAGLSLFLPAPLAHHALSRRAQCPRRGGKGAISAFIEQLQDIDFCRLPQPFLMP